MIASQSEAEWLAGALGSSVREFFADIGVELGPGHTDVMVSCFANPTEHRNEDKVKSCSISLGTALWNCKGCGVKGNAFQAAKAKGYTDKDAMRLAKRYGLFNEGVPKPKLPGAREVRKWVDAIQDEPGILRRLWELKGWTPAVIRRLQLGWDGERITFPVRDHKLKITGVVRYKPGAEPKTLAVAGTKRGLFPAPEIIHPRHTLFVVEGEPDAVSMWACGIRAVGVPGASSWKPEWAQRLYGRKLIVIGDCDGPGRQLANQIAAQMGKNAKMVDLEPGRDDGYDVGDLVREAAESNDLRWVHDWFERVANGHAN